MVLMTRVDDISGIGKGYWESGLYYRRGSVDLYPPHRYAAPLLGGDFSTHSEQLTVNCSLQLFRT